MQPNLPTDDMCWPNELTYRRASTWRRQQAEPDFQLKFAALAAEAASARPGQGSVGGSGNSGAAAAPQPLATSNC